MKVLLNGVIARLGADLLRRHFGRGLTVLTVEEGEDEAAAARKHAEAHVLVTAEFDATTPPAPALRLIQVAGAGLDAVDLGAVPPGCAVCNAFEHEIGIAEYVLAAMLQFVVDLPGCDARFRAGSWADGPRLAGPLRPELSCKTLGCVGYGHIGQAVARRARAFGMRIMAIRRQGRPADPRPDWVGVPGDLSSLLEVADFVLLACPLDDATRGLIGAEELARMRPDAILINVARGPVVVEDALYRALREGRIGGAALDVWYRYASPGQTDVRPSRHPFHELANVIMTPHCSGWTEGLVRRRFALIVENLECLRDGRPLLNQVHPPPTRATA